MSITVALETPYSLARLAIDSPLFLRRTIYAFFSGVVLEGRPIRFSSAFARIRPTERLFISIFTPPKEKST